MGEAVCVWDVRCHLGEGPVWIAEEQALWFVDIKGLKIHRYHPQSGEKQTWDSPEPCGFLAPVEGGGFIAGLQSGLHFFDPTNGGFSLIAEIEPDIPDNRLNDGFVAGLNGGDHAARCRSVGWLLDALQSRPAAERASVMRMLLSQGLDYLALAGALPR